MKVKKIAGINPDDINALEKAFSTISPEKIGCCNWPEDFPYSPDVEFRMFHTGKYLMLKYEVAEEVTAALVTEDNGEVWTDSCVECFVALDNETYYNFEATSIGRVLLANRRSAIDDVIHAEQAVMDKILRFPSWGTEPFEEVAGNNRWSLILCIPSDVLFRHGLESWDGAKVRMNLFKCGDKLSKPHFLSWQPISYEHPAFHLPEFFAEVEFEA